jgi:hypothetical protein
LEHGKVCAERGVVEFAGKIRIRRELGGKEKTQSEAICVEPAIVLATMLKDRASREEIVVDVNVGYLSSKAE